MKLIKSSVEFFGAVPTDYENVLKFIEKAGRTCYKSEGKITNTSAEGFVKRLINAGHLAMIEHSNFVVQRNVAEIPEDILETTDKMIGKYLNYVIKGNTMYIGGNLTAWYQQYVKEPSFKASFMNPFCRCFGELFNINIHGIKSTLWQVCTHDEIPKELNRYAAKFICDRGITHELVRHRPCSFAQESTRYVNYGGKDMEFIEPTGYNNWHELSRRDFENVCKYLEIMYGKLLQVHSPQIARAVLPNALKTEIIVTADAAEWKHIKKLRTDKAAHPDIQRIMNMMPWKEFLYKDVFMDKQ